MKKTDAVKIYKITCYSAYMACEQGSYWSLHPWGKNTNYYNGTDDGGRLFALPVGYYVGDSLDGATIYNEEDNSPCYFCDCSGNIPHIATLYDMIPLRQVEN